MNKKSDIVFYTCPICGEEYFVHGELVPSDEHRCDDCAAEDDPIENRAEIIDLGE